MKRNAMGKIRNLQRFLYMLPLQKINLYNTRVSPHFDYGDRLWVGCHQRQIISLQRIQNFAVKKKIFCKKCMKKLKFSNLEQGREIHLTVFSPKAIPTCLNLIHETQQRKISQYLLIIRTSKFKKASYKK